MQRRVSERLTHALPICTLVSLASLLLAPPIVGRPIRAAEIEADVLLRGATVYDGSGSEGNAGDVAIRGERIVAVGRFEAKNVGRVVDCTGLVIAPGFIDLHTHSDSAIGQSEARRNLNYLRQGCTTVVTGNCGLGQADAGKFLAGIDRLGFGTNVIHLVPHGSLRRSVMGGAQRAPSPEEMDRMRQKLDQAMREGAWGMSTGLIYAPGVYAEPGEIVALAKVVATHRGIYASHIRSESDRLLDAVREAIDVARQARLPVEISHFKSSGKANWGRIRDAARLIEEARREGLAVTADQYPYTASSTSLLATLVSASAIPGGIEKLFERTKSDASLERLVRNQVSRRLTRGSKIVVASCKRHPEYSGKTIPEIAAQQKLDAVEMAMRLLSEGEVQVVNFGMSEDDVRYAMTLPWVATGSDGSAHVPNPDEKPHPRSFGTFPRKIGYYALREKVIPLAQAIRSCTGLAADILGLGDRGYLRPGAYADVVVFDPKEFLDRATYDEPQQYALGVRYLFLAGRPAIDDGKPSEKPLGRAIRHRGPDLGKGDTSVGPAVPADLVLTGGKLVTMDQSRPLATALAAQGDRIIAVGDDATVRPLVGPATRVIQLEGRLVLPGFIEGHGHFLDLGESKRTLDLTRARDWEQIVALVADAARKAPAGQWIVGQGWHQSHWDRPPEPNVEGYPVHEKLSRQTPNHPVYLTHGTGHMCLANAKAMELAGVDGKTPDPPGGQILRDRQGRAIGAFRETAAALIERAYERSRANRSPAEIARERDEQIRLATAECLAKGVTTFHDAGEPFAVIDHFRRLAERGELKVRMWVMIGASPDALAERLPKYRLIGVGNNHLTVRAIKEFMDGALGTHGAWLLEPYNDVQGVGMAVTPPETIRRVARLAIEHDFQLCTHAIGDRANRQVLDIYQEVFREHPDHGALRWRIEHAQHLNPADIPRFGQLGVIASMQGCHATSDGPFVVTRLGQRRAQEGAYAWQPLLKSGAMIVNGSDVPVEDMSPILCFYSSVTRKMADGRAFFPEHCMTRQQALRSYTLDTAYAGFEEHVKGSLTPGKLADVVVLSKDIMAVPEAEIPQAEVLYTIVGGKVLFERGNGAEGPQRVRSEN